MIIAAIVQDIAHVNVPVFIHSHGAPILLQEFNANLGWDDFIAVNYPMKNFSGLRIPPWLVPNAASAAFSSRSKRSFSRCKLDRFFFKLDAASSADCLARSAMRRALIVLLKSLRTNARLSAIAGSS